MIPAAKHYIRNLTILFLALVIAGYPYFNISTFFDQSREGLIVRAVLVSLILLLSIAGVVAFAEREQKERTQKTLLR